MTRAVVTVKEVDFRYSEKSGYILKDVSCRLSLSSRVAVTGPNGAGKSTLIKLMVGDINANKGHVWKHHNLVTAYVAQHSFSHLETVKTKPVMQYIKQRFGRGYDNESSAYKHAPDSDEKFTTSFAERLDEVEEILGRRKFKNALAYEVKWVGKPEHQNTWEDSQTLRKLGAAKLVEQCDERIKAKKSGLDQRPLTNTEVMRHLMDFGLDKQYCMARIEGLSGGQKCKLVLAAALWLRPHLLILDEPTNYLDLEALGAMMRAIDRFKGGLIVVSHNQEFIAETCNEKWDVDGGKLIQTLGIEKPKAVLVRDGRSDGVVPRGRERSQRHSSHRLSGTEEEDTMFVGELFEKIIDAKANAKERDDACDELLVRYTYPLSLFFHSLSLSLVSSLPSLSLSISIFISLFISLFLTLFLSLSISMRT
jgi:elongation factor 3